jgi:hypothetical protein
VNKVFLMFSVAIICVPQILVSGFNIGKNIDYNLLLIYCASLDFVFLFTSLFLSFRDNC